MTMQQFIAAHKIRMDVKWAASNPNMADDKWAKHARHFHCVLRRGRKQLTIPFSQGCAIEHEPEVADVLKRLASDASGMVNASFEEWCREYGYDSDSRKAEKTYQIIKTQAEALSAMLGAEAFETLLWLLAPKPQKSCDHGLFSDEAAQLDLVEMFQDPTNEE